MPSRPTAWGFTNFTQAFTSGLRVTINLLTDLTPSDTITVDRIIVHLEVVPEISAHVIGMQRLVLGIGVCSVEAFAVANSVGVPDPSVSSEIPPRGWLWSDVLTMFTTEGQTNADFIWKFSEVRVDLRASRKVDRGVCFLTVSSKTVLGVGQTVNLIGRVGVLCLT